MASSPKSKSLPQDANITSSTTGKSANKGSFSPNPWELESSSSEFEDNIDGHTNAQQKTDKVQKNSEAKNNSFDSSQHRSAQSTTENKTERENTTVKEDSFDALTHWGGGIAKDEKKKINKGVLQTKESQPKKSISSKDVRNPTSHANDDGNKKTKSSGSSKIITLPSGKRVRRVKKVHAKKYNRDSASSASGLTSNSNSTLQTYQTADATPQLKTLSSTLPTIETGVGESSDDSLDDRVQQALARVKNVHSSGSDVINSNDLSTTKVGQNLSPPQACTTPPISSKFQPTISDDASIDSAQQRINDILAPKSVLKSMSTENVKDEQQSQTSSPDRDGLPKGWARSPKKKKREEFKDLPSGWIQSHKQEVNDDPMSDWLNASNYKSNNRTTEGCLSPARTETPLRTNVSASKSKSPTFLSRTLSSVIDEDIVNTGTAGSELDKSGVRMTLAQMKATKRNDSANVDSSPKKKEKKSPSRKQREDDFPQFDPLESKSSSKSFAYAKHNRNPEYVDYDSNDGDDDVTDDDSQSYTSRTTYTEDRTQDTNESSIFGPMWKRAASFAYDEKDRKENRLREKFEEIRARAPSKIHVSNQAKNIRNLHEQEQVNLRRGAKLSQSLLAKTRSRADVDKVDGMFVAPAQSLFRAAEDKNMASRSMDYGDGDNSRANDAFITANIARKRTKVVQLLLFGLLGIVAGFFGSIYTQSTCDFAVAEVSVGGNDNKFKLHFGMWKYSPLNSVFQNYAYCYKYDDEYANEAPTIVRLSTFFALLTGSFSLTVLWSYLILGVTTEGFWKSAVRLLFFSGVFQCTSLLFFAGELCRNNECSMGPGAIMSLFTTITWFLLAYQMHVNTPCLAMLPEIPQSSRTTPLVDLELPEISQQIKRSWKGLPFLSSLRSQSEEEKPTSLATLAKRSKMRRTMGHRRRSYSESSYTDDDDDDEYDDESSYCPPQLDEDESVVV